MFGKINIKLIRNSLEYKMFKYQTEACLIWYNLWENLRQYT